jgi:hypothetical protein
MNTDERTMRKSTGAASADGRSGTDSPVRDRGQARRGPSEPPPTSDSAAALDRWFDIQLNRMYADVVSEPLPKEFLELLDKLRDKQTE